MYSVSDLEPQGTCVPWGPNHGSFFVILTAASGGLNEVALMFTKIDKSYMHKRDDNDW